MSHGENVSQYDLHFLIISMELKDGHFQKQKQILKKGEQNEYILSRKPADFCTRIM